MTFDETLALLNWAAEQNALSVQIGEVSVQFSPKAAPKEAPAPDRGYSPHETRKHLDQAMFGMDLDTLAGNRE